MSEILEKEGVRVKSVLLLASAIVVVLKQTALNKPLKGASV